nr:isopentenyl-diphosphate delta-isomerase I [Tanacetum cinerariifolium]
MELELEQSQQDISVVELYFVRTTYQLAYIFTKALGRERLVFLINELGMRRFIHQDFFMRVFLNLLKKGLLVRGEAMEASERRRIMLDYRIQQLSKGSSEGSGIIPEVSDETKDNSVSTTTMAETLMSKCSSQFTKPCSTFSLSSSSNLFQRQFMIFKPRSSFTASMSSFSSSMGTSSSILTDADSTMDAVQRRLMFEDECILVDANDAVVGHDTKYNCHLMEKIESENLLHRAFSVFLFNSKYELLLQQRSVTKVTFPLVWTNTCCSHPLYRESELIEENYLGVRNAAQRKLLDELGIPSNDLPVNEFIPLGRILYKAPSDGKWGEHELDYLLFIVRDVSMDPNPDEVAEVKYVNREQLKELVMKADLGEEGLKLSPWFRIVVDNFLFKWWDHVENGSLLEASDMKTIHNL